VVCDNSFVLRNLLDLLVARPRPEPRPALRDQMVHFMLQSAWTWLSIQSVWDDLPRWERRLRSRGVTFVSPLGQPVWSHERSKGHNEMVLLMMQSQMERDAAAEHHQRNLTGARPYKP
jgi:hypothetical protein